MRQLVSILALTGALCACSDAPDGSPEELVREADEALAAGDHSRAHRFYEAALLDLAPGTRARAAARIGALRALALTEPAEVRSRFLELAAAEPGLMLATDYYELAESFGAEGAAAAGEILNAGKQHFPESAEVYDRLAKRLVAAAQSRGDAAAVRDLESLGYVGSK